MKIREKEIKYEKEITRQTNLYGFAICLLYEPPTSISLYIWYNHDGNLGFFSYNYACLYS